MRQPHNIERLYLDFDGFFASVEQQVHPHLRGKPIGVVPVAGAQHTSIIACSREAKLRGLKNVGSIKEARERCPDIILVPQSPDLYRRAHNALLSEISTVVPIDAVKSIDELTCIVALADRANPQALGQRIKKRIAENVGPFIECSIGFAANRQLAKMACKAGKPSGNMVWHPKDMPGPLLKLQLKDIPGVGARMERRLARFGIATMSQLLATQPKQMRKLWGNVIGERLWYALHGYDVQSPPSERAMYGHNRVMPPHYCGIEHARTTTRLLAVKAARRMRREGWNAGRIWLWLELVGNVSATGALPLPAVHDDQAVLAALESLWNDIKKGLRPAVRILRVGVTLLDLTPASERQLDIFLNDDPGRQKAEKATNAIDALNRKYGRTLVSVGPWLPPPGGHEGGKISYSRVPRAEDFW